MSIVAAIKSLPAEEQLMQALWALDYVTGGDPARNVVQHYIRHYGARPCGAKLLHLLVQNTGRPVSIDQIAYSLNADGATSSESIKVHVSYLRKAISPVRVTTVWGHGYLISEEQAARLAPAPPPSHRVSLDAMLAAASAPEPGLPRLFRAVMPWTREEDRDMVRRREAGETWETISVQMGRPIRGCTSRWYKIHARSA